MKISKQTAEKVANEMTSKKQEELKKMTDTLEILGYEIAKSVIPKDVLIIYEKYKYYFNTSNTLLISGPGINKESINFKKELPTTQWCINKTLNKNESEKIRQLLDKKLDLNKELILLKNDIVNALLSLGTSKRIETEFKEAFKFLPKNTENKALIVNLDSIRTKLKYA